MTDMVFGESAPINEDNVYVKWWRTVDHVTLGCILALLAIGVLLSLAASVPLAQRNDLPEYHYVYRHVFFGGLGLLAILYCSTRSIKTLRRLGILGFSLGVVAILLLPVLGTDYGKGAIRWYSLGFASVQPSEFLKPCFVLFTAWLMSGSFQVGGIKGQRLSFLICAVLVLVLALQPDYGQATLLLASWIVMYFVAGAPIAYLAGIGGLVGAAGYVAYQSSEHVARRINDFLDPNLDPRTQLGYATDAIQEGGLFGVGVGEGSVKWALPDAHTDFIIAVAAEEYGLVMVLTIIALFGLVVFRAFMRIMRESDIFIRLAGTGLASLFAFQAFINLGVAVRLLPAKGMTLPFISYGGSSMVAAGILLGTLLAFTRSRLSDRDI